MAPLFRRCHHSQHTLIDQALDLLIAVTQFHQYLAAVLTQTRSRSLDARGSLIKARGRSGLSNTARDGVIVFVDQIIGLNLRMGNHIFSRQHRR